MNPDNGCTGIVIILLTIYTIMLTIAFSLYSLFFT